MHIFPSSFNASLMSRIRIRSLALLADLRTTKLGKPTSFWEPPGVFGFSSSNRSSDSADFLFFAFLLVVEVVVVLGVGDSQAVLLLAVSLIFRFLPEAPLSRWCGSW